MPDLLKLVGTYRFPDPQLPFQRQRIDADRMSFREVVWSANILNFDRVRMPQSDLSDYANDYFLFTPHTYVDYRIAKIFLGRKGLIFAGVLDAFYFVLHYPSAVGNEQEIIALGSHATHIKSTNVFFPTILRIGDVTSLGISSLGVIDGSIVLHPGNLYLAVGGAEN